MTKRFLNLAAGLFLLSTLIAPMTISKKVEAKAKRACAPKLDRFCYGGNPFGYVLKDWGLGGSKNPFKPGYSGTLKMTGTSGSCTVSSPGVVACQSNESIFGYSVNRFISFQGTKTKVPTAGSCSASGSIVTCSITYQNR